MKKILIDERLLEICHSIQLGCIQYEAKVENSNTDLCNKIDEVSKNTISQITLEEIVENMHIKSAREIYRRIGKEPSRYRISSEALIRRLVQGKGLHKINNVVDTNNLISIETKLSVGSYDVSKLGSNLVFRIGENEETYKGIGKENINLENLPVFSDEIGAYGSPTSDSKRAMITSDTKKILTVLISFTENFDMEKAVKESTETIKKYLNAKNIETCISHGDKKI